MAGLCRGAEGSLLLGAESGTGQAGGEAGGGREAGQEGGVIAVVLDAQVLVWGEHLQGRDIAMGNFIYCVLVKFLR